VAARVLAAAGAAVTRVEDERRPDGARAAPAFHQWLHAAGELTETLDLHSRAGRDRAAALIDEADVVIEGSRPRALEQLGLGPGDRPDRPGRVWLSVTGHGREGPSRDWVAFGDDAAVAGGLVGWDPAGEPVFAGDAIADPLTGLAGAVAVLRALDTGGGQLIDLAMSRVAAFGAKPPEASDCPGVVRPDRDGGWSVRAGPGHQPIRDQPARLEWISRR
jgi:crotonobetainyl-CoA:carnitine CoA-transferase CaiB-like acyl-CoA transferase